MIRVSDRDPAVLRELDHAGMGPGSKVWVDAADAVSVAVAVRAAESPVTQEAPGCPGVSLVAPTGIDPVTFRFSVERSTN